MNVFAILHAINESAFDSNGKHLEMFVKIEKKTLVDRLAVAFGICYCFFLVVVAMLCAIPHECRCVRFGSIRCLSTLNLFAFLVQVSRITRKCEMHVGYSPFFRQKPLHIQLKWCAYDKLYIKITSY